MKFLRLNGAASTFGRAVCYDGRMAKPDEFHLTLQLLPSGDYSVLDGLPSEHGLKSMGAHRFDLPKGRVMVWTVDCNLSSAKVLALTQAAIDALE